MDPFGTRPLGNTGLSLPVLGFGGAGLGNLFDEVDDSTADATLDAAWAAGIRYYDTSPWYGRGLSEHRLGRMLRNRPRQDFTLSTKVGRLLTAPRDPAAFQASERAWSLGLDFEHHYDFSYDGIMRSFEDSLQRLGLNSVDLLIIHDLDGTSFPTDVQLEAHMHQLATGGVRALEDFKVAKVITAYGAGVNRVGTIPALLDIADLDFFLVATPYTLAEQPVLDAEFPQCAARGVGVVIGAVYASGILASGPVPGARLNYREPEPEEAHRIGRIHKVCESFGVPLAAAALQFPLHHPLVASVIPGALEPGHVTRTVETMRHDIPDELWTQLKSEGLLREDAPTPQG